MRPMLLTLCFLLLTVVAVADPLPSWNDTDVKAAIIDYLGDVTDTGSEDFIPFAERVAVLDNDGTFWCERPHNASSSFQKEMLRHLVNAGDVDGQAMPYRAWLEDDRDALRSFGWGKAYTAMNATFAGWPIEAYRDSARAYVRRTHHERFGVPHTELVYAPMRELAALLTSNGFQVWVVTGSEQSFIRSYLESVVGIPPERVIGTWTTPVYKQNDGDVSMVRGAEQVYNGHEHKPANIAMRIGRRPVFAAGNSNNDQPMCRMALTGEHRGLAIWIKHDDEDREYAYDRGTSRISGLCKERNDAHVVSIKRDWARVFSH